MNHKKRDWPKIILMASGFCAIAMVAGLVMAFMRYSSTDNSTPLWVYMSSALMVYGTPTLFLLIVGLILKAVTGRKKSGK